MFFLHCRLNILRYEKIFREIDESIVSQHDPSSDVIFLGVHSKSIFTVTEYFISRKLCFHLFSLSLAYRWVNQLRYIHLVNLLCGFSWKLLPPLEQYCQSHLMNLIQLINCWRADDEFSWNNFYFIVAKEFWYSKKY